MLQSLVVAYLASDTAESQELRKYLTDFFPLLLIVEREPESDVPGTVDCSLVLGRTTLTEMYDVDYSEQ